MINRLVSTFLAAGSFGFINYWVLIHLGLKSERKLTSHDAVMYSLIFSVPDFIIFLILQQFCQAVFSGLNADWKLIFSAALSFIIIFLLTLVCGQPLVSAIYSLINLFRRKGHKADIVQESPWSELEIGTAPAMAYFYDFDKHPLGFGYIRTISNDFDNNYSMNLEPFVDDTKGAKQLDYNTLIDYIQSKEWQEKYTITQHINLKQKFILIVLQEKSII
jgi:hypothetical protein